MVISLIDMHHGEFRWRPDSSVVPSVIRRAPEVHDQFGCIIFLAWPYDMGYDAEQVGLKWLRIASL